MWLSSQYEHRSAWVVYRPTLARARSKGDGPTTAAETERAVQGSDSSLAALIGEAAVAALVILIGGFALARTGDAIAAQTGLGANFIGFVLVGFATGLPELSAIYAAVKLRRYEMAIGEILGSNLWNIAFIFLIDVLYSGGPVLSEAGRFETAATLLGLILVCIYLIGLVERGDRAVLRMGYDSLAVLAVFVVGVIVLWSIARQG
jgi:cation:H+ antiporter